jgi:branched-chain amino acid transport system substrate-binding protein
MAGVVAGLLVLTTACGTSGTGGSGASNDDIPIGVVGSYSGSASSAIAGARDSIQAWAESVNAAGGINGKKIKLYVEDDGGGTSTSLTKVKSLVEKDEVVAIVGQASTVSVTWQSYIEGKGIPVVGGNNVQPTYLSSPDFFNVGGNLVANYYGISELAKGNGPTIGNVYCAELPDCENTVVMLKSAGTSTGVDVSFTAKITSSSPDYTAVCQGLKGADVHSYALGIPPTTQAKLLTQCRQQGVDAKVVLGSTADSTYPGNPAYEGALAVDAIFPFFDESIPATQEFHAAISKYSPQLGTPALPLNPEVSQAWASGKLFEAAVQASGKTEITPDSVKAGLYALKGETLDGLTMPLTFTPGKATLHNCFFTYAIQGGKYVTPNGLKVTCAPDAAIVDILARLKH